jgi:hypothetical protein
MVSDKNLVGEHAAKYLPRLEHLSGIMEELLHILVWVVRIDRAEP